MAMLSAEDLKQRRNTISPAGDVTSLSCRDDRVPIRDYLLIYHREFYSHNSDWGYSFVLRVRLIVLSHVFTFHLSRKAITEEMEVFVGVS